MPKILIADDSALVRTQMKNALEAGGHEVVEAEDGEDGIRKVNSNQDLELIITDINMPNMDGLTMCSNLRNEMGCKLPIIMLTTEAGPETKAKGKEVGVVAWMIKPFNPEKTLAAIGKILSR